jgi:hypothetical protein
LRRPEGRNPEGCRIPLRLPVKPAKIENEAEIGRVKGT